MPRLQVADIDHTAEFGQIPRLSDPVLHNCSAHDVSDPQQRLGRASQMVDPEISLDELSGAELLDQVDVAVVLRAS
jgi:hypothetical protein